jgi:hypothetical protein
MDPKTIEKRANSYSSSHEKRSAQTYTLRGQERRLPPHGIPSQFRTPPSLEPRIPIDYRMHLISVRRRRLEERFQTLVKKWKKEVAFEPSLTDALMNHNYLKIIGLGPSALPLIFRELEREPDLWFLALESITHEDPAVSEENSGDFRKIAELWIQWGREHGFI